MLEGLEVVCETNRGKFRGNLRQSNCKNTPLVDCKSNSSFSPIQINEVEHPYQKNVISDEEKVLLEVEYLLWFLSSPDGAPYETTDSEDLKDTDGAPYETTDSEDLKDTDGAPYETTDSEDLKDTDGAPCESTDSEDLKDTDGVFSLEKLMEFPALRKLCDTEERLR